MIKQRITHCSLVDVPLDPYALIASKSSRFSWNLLGGASEFLNKKEVIEWLSLLRPYSDDTVQSILVDGILNSEFHNITFILNLVQKDDFNTMPSKQVYHMLYEFVSQTPEAIREWIEHNDFLMSRDVLALLSRNR